MKSEQIEKIINLNEEVIVYNYKKHQTPYQAILADDYKDIILKLNYKESLAAMLDYKDSVKDLMLYTNKDMKLAWLSYGFNLFDIIEKVPEEALEEAIYLDTTGDFIMTDILNFICRKLGSKIKINDTYYSLQNCNQIEGYDFLKLRKIMIGVLDNTATIKGTKLKGVLNIIDKDCVFVKEIEKKIKIDKF